VGTLRSDEAERRARSTAEAAGLTRAASC